MIKNKISPEGRWAIDDFQRNPESAKDTVSACVEFSIRRGNDAEITEIKSQLEALGCTRVWLSAVSRIGGACIPVKMLGEVSELSCVGYIEVGSSFRALGD